jgi:hypothetical protein
MAEATTPTLPIGGYSTSRQLTDDEREEWNRQAEAKREQIRVSALAMIGRDADGRPFSPPDASEEERLATGDLRGALRQAQLDRRQISLRGVDQKDAFARGQQHLENARAELRDLERRSAAGERAAAERLADSFRGSQTPVEELRASAKFPTTSEIEAARLAVQRAEAAVERLAAEAEATRAELGRAQYVVDRAVADVVRQKLLAIAHRIDEHDRAAAELRASMRTAGFATADVQRRPGWRAVRVFTSTMTGILDRQALDGTSRADWRDFIRRLDQDHTAELE